MLGLWAFIPDGLWHLMSCSSLAVPEQRGQRDNEVCMGRLSLVPYLRMLMGLSSWESTKGSRQPCFRLPPVAPVLRPSHRIPLPFPQPCGEGKGAANVSSPAERREAL